MKALYWFDDFSSRHIAGVIMIGAAAGVLFPSVFVHLNPFVTLLFAVMTFINSLGSGFREMGAAVKNPLPVLVTLGTLHVVMPILATALGNLFFADEPYFITGLVLQFSLPTAVMALMWVGLSRGNTPLIIPIILVDTMLAPFVVPLALRLLVGSEVSIDPISMMESMIYMIAIPSLLGMACYDLSKGKVARTIKPKLSPFAKICTLLLITCNASGCADFLYQLNRVLLYVILVVVILCLTGFGLGYLFSRLMKLDFPSLDAVTLACGLRNFSAGAVLAMEYFPAQVLFPVAFSPLFMHVLTALIIKILRRTRLGQEDQAAYERQLAEEAASPS